MSLQKRQKRQAAILAVVNEMREDSTTTGSGLHPTNYERDDLFDCIENCVGFRLSDIEHRLAVVGFEQGADTAKQCIWYI